MRESDNDYAFTLADADLQRCVCSSVKMIHEESFTAAINRYI